MSVQRAASQVRRAFSLISGQFLQFYRKYIFYPPNTEFRTKKIFFSMVYITTPL